MDGGKGQLRRETLARRRALTAQQLALAADALVVAVKPLATGRVAAYASSGTEPGTGPLLAALAEVLLPVLRAGGDLDWALYEGELVPGLRGTREPPGARLGVGAVADCRLVVVPALGVDRVGHRLGRGGGSYDRALPRARGLVVAALHVGELHDSLPAEPHDRSVDAVVLPDRGLVRLRAHPLDEARDAPGGMTS